MKRIGMTKDQMRQKLEDFHINRLSRIGNLDKFQMFVESYKTMSLKKIEKEYNETFFEEPLTNSERMEMRNTFEKMGVL